LLILPLFLALLAHFPDNSFSEPLDTEIAAVEDKVDLGVFNIALIDMEKPFLLAQNPETPMTENEQKEGEQAPPIDETKISAVQQALAEIEKGMNVESEPEPEPEPGPTEPEAPEPEAIQENIETEPSVKKKRAKKEDEKDSVEINGDIVEYSVDREKVTASGNVVIINKDMRLHCDRVEFSRSTNMAYATGNVRLVMTKGDASEMTGEKLTFNFKTMMGKFDNANIYAAPYFGFGEEVEKVGENHMKMTNDYITTCDHDKPHFRIASKKMDIYPGDKLIARNVRMFISKLPVLYIPKFTQDLSKKKPIVTFTPGHDKEWGTFLLTQWRYYFSDNFKGIAHVDVRERKGVGWGFDVNYKTPQYGLGKIRTYYMNERTISPKRYFEDEPEPVIAKERFRAEWRHKWEIDENTNAIAQYSKQSDSTILKEYFEREFDEDFSQDTYFLLTRNLPVGFMSFRTDARVNRFVSDIERLPEVRYDLANQRLGGTGFFLRNQTTYSNLTSKLASPSEVRKNTMRTDFDNELTHPFKVGFVELNPFVGGRNTYYSKTKIREDYGSIRGIFKSGASMSTRFFRIFDVNVDKFGLNINRLRHIITPSVAYRFENTPSILPEELDQFDSIDSLALKHMVNFSLENKLQTKRNGRNVDLFRMVIDTDFRLKEEAGRGGFDKIDVSMDFVPMDWLTFYFQSQYDTQAEYLNYANFDMYINGGTRWSLDIGKRWSRNADDQLTTSFKYSLNPKWALKSYTRFDLRNGILKEQEYTVSRDLHAWVMDINFNETRRQGNEIWLVFTLKAFPDLALDIGTSFNKRKLGSQSSEGD